MRLDEKKLKVMRLEELYAFQIKRIAKDTGDVLERFIKIGKATKPQMRLAKTRKDHTPIGNVDYFVDVDLIWQSSNQGLFWEEKLTLKMERALRNKCFRHQPFIPYVGEGTGKTEMFVAGDTSANELKETIKGFMSEIVARIRLTGNPIVNHNQLDELFKKGEL